MTSCAECGATLQESAKFCSQCGQAAGGASSLPPSQAGSVYPPPHLTQRVLASRAALEGERKQVTVLFADLRGSLGFLAGIDAEESQTLLDTVVSAMVEAVHRYEGAVNQVMGDGIMALFGAPIAHEDHALRAACAALAMQESVHALRDPSWEAHRERPQIRVGLHSGEVAIRTVRNDLSMDYRAVGPTTHIAARMEQLATPGTIWLTDDTYKLGNGLLRTTPIGPTKIKGVPKPIDVHVLHGISVRTRFQANALRGLSPLVGREDTLAQLRAALALAVSGRSQVAVLCGDPGVGKSRLCYEVMQSADSRVRVLEASARSYLSTHPHGLLASMVRALFGIEDDDDVEQVRAKAERSLNGLAIDPRHLQVALDLLDVQSRDAEWNRLDPVQRRRRIEAMLRELLTAWCALGPAVVLCEDLHWSDPESLTFISTLVDSPPGDHTLLLLTHRPEPLPMQWSQAAHVRSFEIRALDAETADTMLTTLLGGALAPEPLRIWLAARCDGNPFFIEESARAVLDSGLIEQHRQPSSPSVNVPASIDALLSARVDRLPDTALDVLQAAAVLGDQGSLETLRAVMQLPAEEFAMRLAELGRAELLYEVVSMTSDDRRPPLSAASLRFKHALIQEVVYNRLLRPRKRALHAQVFEVIERQYSARLGEYVEQLAEHAFRAELWDKCAEYLRMACIRAANRGANALAIAHLERGLEALRHVPEGPEHARAAIDLRLTALAALLPSGAHVRVIELLREAEHYAEQLQDAGRRARIACQLSAELWATAQYDAALESAESALALARVLAGPQFGIETSARYVIASVQHARGEYATSLGTLRALLTEFEGENEQRRLGWAGYPSVLLRSFIITVSNMTGGFEEARRAFDVGRELAERLNHAFSRTMIMEQWGMCLLVQGDYRGAEHWLRLALDVCEREAVGTMLLPIACHLSLALLKLERVGEARELLEHGVREGLSKAGRYAFAYLAIAESELRRCSGRPDEARAIAERAVQDTLACGEPGFHVRALLQLARVLAGKPGGHEAALAAYRDALARARELEMSPWCALALQGAATLHAERGERALAADGYDAALRIWSELGAPARVEQVAALKARA